MIKKPKTETIKKIDFMIQGLEDGKYADLANEVEFYHNLKGDQSNPEYISTLLAEIDDLRVEVDTLTSQCNNLNEEQIRLQQKYDSLSTDMNIVAKAIRNLYEPKPLSKSYDLGDIDRFCASRGATSY